MNLNIALFAVSVAANADSANLVLGMGSGTLSIIIAGIIGILICIFRDVMVFPSLMICIGCCIPLVVLLIVTQWPKQDYAATEAARARRGEPDEKIAITAFFCAFSLLCLILALLALCSISCNSIKVKRMDSELGSVQHDSITESTQLKEKSKEDIEKDE